MDTAIINLAIRHMRSTGCSDAAGREFKNQYPLLAEALSEVCVAEAGGSKYSALARELPQIVTDLAMDSKLLGDNEMLEDLLERIKSIRRDMSKGARASLAPAFLLWIARRHARYFDEFLVRIGIDRQALQTNVAGVGATAASLMSLDGLCDAAKSRLILIGQNHWYLVSTDDGKKCWRMIADSIRRGVSVDIVGMHPEIGPRGVSLPGLHPADAIGVWSAHMNTPEFGIQIEHFWMRMAEWEYWQALLDESSEDIGQFRAYGAYFTPMTMSFVDPEESDGIVVLSPRTNDPKSTSRHQFAIYKEQNPDAFTYYWAYAQNALSDYHWVKMIG